VLELQTQYRCLTFSMYHWLLFSFCSSFLIQYGMGWCSAGRALFYKAQSQDEDALVQAAAQLQVLLCSKMGSVVGGYFLLHHNLLIAVVLLLWVYNV
jgi:hypothetical protein